jgi:transcription elongation factor GreA
VSSGDLRRRRAAEQREPALHLVAKQLEHAANADLAAGGETVEDRTADEHRLRAERERDGHVDADYERAADQLRRLSWLVEHAAHAEDLPDDPARVELGETVTVQVDGGAPERFLIVHPVEAPLDDTRISAESPLARALLGRRIGEHVRVAAPSGAYRCRILAAERATPASPRGRHQPA